MLIEKTQTEPNWTLLPGTILDGGYELEELLQADQGRARFKVRVLGDRTIEAFASFAPINDVSADEQIEAWNLLRSNPHVNVSTPLAVGRRELESLTVVYVILRRADETLNAVLGERALNPDEASEVLSAGSRALDYLEMNGLLHAAIEPEEILAVGDSIQLSAEKIRTVGTSASPVQARYLAPESVCGNTTMAASIWCLGATLFETLTQKFYDESCHEDAAQLPLGWILQRCLETQPESRCKPNEIPALLKAGPPSTVTATPQALVASSVDLDDPSLMPPPTVSEYGEIPAGTAALAAAAGSSLSAAVTAGPATNEYAAPTLPDEPASPETPVPRPAITSVSQARIKVFKQSEFDTLTAPQEASSAAAAKASSAAAVSGSSLVRGRVEPPNSRSSRRLATTGTGSGGASPTVAIPRSPSLKVPPSAMESIDSERNARRRDLNSNSEAQYGRLWIYLAGGLVVLLLMFWALRTKSSSTSPSASRSSSSPAQTTTAPPPASTTDRTAANKAWPTRTLEPDQSLSGARSASANEAKSSKADSASSGPAVWRVIVFAFNRQEDAEKRARSLNAKHPHLQAQVFSPNGHSGPYLVTLGGRMTHDEAARFRSKSLSLGLPHDSYIQNYR